MGYGFSAREGVRPEHAGLKHRSSLPLFFTGALLVGGLFLLRLPLLRVHNFDADELYHLHSAWCVSKGMLPYRDYFEHHTPWLYFCLSPFYSAFDVDANLGDAIAFIYLSRGAMWLLTGASLLLTFRLGKLWGGRGVAWGAVVLLSGTILFLDKTLEIRPDVPSLPLLLASFLSLISGIRQDQPSSRQTAWRFAGSGFLLGAAMMFQQKILFAGPGFTLAMLWYLLDPRGHGRFKSRLINFLWQSLAFAVPVLVTMGYFALRGGWWEFVEFNLLLNLRFPHKVAFSPYAILLTLVRQNPFVVALGLCGFVQAFLHMFERGRYRRADFVLVLNTLGLFVGGFIFPLPYPHYYLMFLPLLSLLAATYLVHLVELVSGGGTSRAGRPWRRHLEEGLLMVLGGSALWHALSLARAGPGHQALYLLLGIMVAVMITPLLLPRARDWTLSLLLLAASIHPTSLMLGILKPSNTKYQDTLDGIGHVLRHTAPTDDVMDGFTGLGVFRPDSYFLRLLLRETRAMVSEQEHSRLLADLGSGRIAPKLVFFDSNLRRFSSEVAWFVEQNYEPAGQGVIWRPKPAWLDEEHPLDLGTGPMDRLAGPGWYEPENEEGISYRRSRGKRSWLRVPIRQPQDLRVTLRARWDYVREPASLDLAANGESVGRVDLVRGWRDYTFAVPARILKPGLNSFLLTSSVVPRQVDPSFRGRNSLIAVDYLKLDVTARTDLR